METQDLRTLKILERVDNGYCPSQRDLARELNISLGLVNSFIKRLAHKGYVKITTIPTRRIQYILTPKGMAEKSRLTYRYIQFSYQYYRQARQKIRDLFVKLEKEGARRIVFYGATDLAEIAFLSLQETAIELAGVVDERSLGKKMLGREVAGCKALSHLVFDRVVVTHDGDRNLTLETLLSTGIKRSQVVFID